MHVSAAITENSMGAAGKKQRLKYDTLYVYSEKLDQDNQWHGCPTVVTAMFNWQGNRIKLEIISGRRIIEYVKSIPCIMECYLSFEKEI